jgi:hypothetical protein
LQTWPLDRFGTVAKKACLRGWIITEFYLKKKLESGVKLKGNFMTGDLFQQLGTGMTISIFLLAIVTLLFLIYFKLDNKK